MPNCQKLTHREVDPAASYLQWHLAVVMHTHLRCHLHTIQHSILHRFPHSFSLPAVCINNTCPVSQGIHSTCLLDLCFLILLSSSISSLSEQSQSGSVSLNGWNKFTVSIQLSPSNIQAMSWLHSIVENSCDWSKSGKSWIRNCSHYTKAHDHAQTKHLYSNLRTIKSWMNWHIAIWL
jgi:hypothetical protein